MEKFVTEVIDFPDEGQVGLVVDYRVAAVIKWLLGACAASCGGTDGLYERLGSIPTVEGYYDHITENYSNAFDGSPPNFNQFIDTGVMPSE